jgi:hypothetical protein
MTCGPLWIILDCSYVPILLQCQPISADFIAVMKEQSLILVKGMFGNLMFHHDGAMLDTWSFCFR